MDEAKKKRLEERGWKIGTVAELLGMSEEETHLLETKLEQNRVLSKGSTPKPRRQPQKKVMAAS